MDERLIVRRSLPDGRICRVSPFHISLEGLESSTICRDEEDYDVMVKYICLCARRFNVLVVIYCVVSNHAHIAVLAEKERDAEKYAEGLKKVQSMWLRRKYEAYKTLMRTQHDVLPIETVRHARNAFAYIPRNAIDNGSSIVDYKWSGFRAMFCKGNTRSKCYTLSRMTTREQEKIMHSGDDLRSVPWSLNDKNELEPVSFCDWQYLERLFNGDQSFFLRAVGEVNTVYERYELSVVRRKRMTDSDFMKTVNDFSNAWYGVGIDNLSPAQKARFLGFLGKKMRLYPPQVARCLRMEREDVEKILG